MSIDKIKSFAKINLSLGVLGKLKPNLHRIESIISFINLHDEIIIKRINNDKHIVIFYGKFSKNITKNNSINKLLYILDKKNILKDKKYLIKVNKKIPLKSGMGGGSMNASSVLRYFMCKRKVSLNNKLTLNIANQIGSDVIVGLKKKNSILQGNRKILRFKKKIGLYVVIIKPNFGCLTKKIYNNINFFSKPTLEKKNHNIFNIDKLINLSNDLERVAFKIYPALSSIKQNMLDLPNIKFVRMTGSGSSMIGYFNSKKASLNAAKILKKIYKNYWCILSKTI